MAETPADVLPLRLLLAGATGVVGRAVLDAALEDQRFSEVVALTRRPLPPSPKLSNIVADFSALPDEGEFWAVDAVICALGTTLKTAGSQANFVAVDRDLPILLAKRALAQGATRFALCSSLGADPASGNFYLRTKGEAEQGLRRLGYSRLTIVRPSLIDADRVATRPGEKVAILASRLLRPLIPARYRPVSPAAIADALITGVTWRRNGNRIVESDAIGQPSRVPGP
jgi:uncharacterized protein YbjT (DUF2867 family)